MSPAETPPRVPPGLPSSFRRVVLALDPGADYRAALSEAIRLATALHAELSALFVEDTGLLDAARHSFVRRYAQMTDRWEPFGEHDVESAFKDLANRVRAAVAEAAGRDRLPWSFTVVRGEVEAAALEAARDADLVILGAGLDALQAGLRAPSLARLGKRARERSVLYVRPKAPIARLIVVAYDGAPGADHALAVAARLATPSELTVALIAPDAKAAAKLEAQAKSVLGDRTVGTAFITMPKASAAELCGLSSRVGAGALVFGADNPLLRSAAARKRLDETTCRVLVVR
jgi:nucleotide-binding universal stress UspA family protein